MDPISAAFCCRRRPSGFNLHAIGGPATEKPEESRDIYNYRTTIPARPGRGEMAFDEAVAGRVREALAGAPDVVEKKMFGGIAFMVRGNMCCGVIGDRLMLRVGPDGHEAALSRPHARPMDFTGRPMKGMVYVEPAGFASAADLKSWIARAMEFTLSLPAK